MQITHDKKLLIATGRSRKAAQWQNREMLWSEFLEKLARPTRTRETAAEYAAMGKAERDDVKDIGGFVGGYLKNGRRSNAGVVNRCLVCLDADNADAALVDDLDMTFINAYALYSTHSHTPEKSGFGSSSRFPHGHAGRVRRRLPPDRGRADACPLRPHDL